MLPGGAIQSEHLMYPAVFVALQPDRIQIDSACRQDADAVDWRKDTLLMHACVSTGDLLRQRKVSSLECGLLFQSFPVLLRRSRRSATCFIPKCLESDKELVMADREGLTSAPCCAAHLYRSVPEERTADERTYSNDATCPAFILSNLTALPLIETVPSSSVTPFSFFRSCTCFADAGRLLHAAYLDSLMSGVGRDEHSLVGTLPSHPLFCICVCRGKRPVQSFGISKLLLPHERRIASQFWR